MDMDRLQIDGLGMTYVRGMYGVDM